MPRVEHVGAAGAWIVDDGGEGAFLTWSALRQGARCPRAETAAKYARLLRTTGTYGPWTSEERRRAETGDVIPFRKPEVS